MKAGEGAGMQYAHLCLLSYLGSVSVKCASNIREIVYGTCTFLRKKVLTEDILLSKTM